MSALVFCLGYRWATSDKLDHFPVSAVLRYLVTQRYD
jgi:hypothetical protein